MRGAPGQGKRLRWGLASTAAGCLLVLLIWGRGAILAAATFGLVATGLQLLAARTMARSGVPAALDHLKVYLVGLAMRLSGVVILAIAVTVDRETFPPLASAVGYLGAVLPLLYLETRLAQ